MTFTSKKKGWVWKSGNTNPSVTANHRRRHQPWQQKRAPRDRPGVSNLPLGTTDLVSRATGMSSSPLPSYNCPWYAQGVAPVPGENSSSRTASQCIPISRHKCFQACSTSRERKVGQKGQVRRIDHSLLYLECLDGSVVQVLQQSSSSPFFSEENRCPPCAVH